MDILLIRCDPQVETGFMTFRVHDVPGRITTTLALWG